MAQQGGFGNTAPQPLPGSSNPTGNNVNLGGVGNLPSSPLGTSSHNPLVANSPTSPSTAATAAPTAFPANGTGAFNPGQFGGLFGKGSNAGIGSSLSADQQSSLFKELERAYGKGTGQLLAGLFQNGVFSAQDASALLNALQPAAARGNAAVLDAFGGAGARFSSEAAIGVGDYQSQVFSTEAATLANLDIQSKQDQLSLLSNTLPTLHVEQANASEGWFQKFLGYLEIGTGLVSIATGGNGGGLIGAGNQTVYGNQGSVPNGAVIPNYQNTNPNQSSGIVPYDQLQTPLNNPNNFTTYQDSVSATDALTNSPQDNFGDYGGYFGGPMTGGN